MRLKHFCRSVLLLALLAGLLPLTGSEAEAAGRIKVTFTNRTEDRVTFFLNGGAGLESRLDADESQTYTMAVDDGVEPIIKIYQPTGGSKTFTVKNGGKYAFKFKDGVITNFFD